MRVGSLMSTCRYVFLFLWDLRRAFFVIFQAPHLAAAFYQRAALTPFLDSGAWDYCLGQLFDAIFRGGFVFSLLSLSEHGWGERAVGRLWVTLTSAAPGSASPVGGFYHFIFLLLKVFLLVLWLLGFYAFACCLVGFKWGIFYLRLPCCFAVRLV